MKLGLFYSERDVAGVNMAREIASMMGEQFSLSNATCEIVPNEREILYINEDNAKDFDYIIVLSRHSGTPGRPIFTAHVPGNFGPAKFGGDPFTLGVAIPSIMKEYLLSVSKEALEIGYEVGFEPTHHGPTLNTPMAFLEIGCDERAWKDPRAVSVAASSVLKSIERWDPSKYRPAIAFGGPHINHHFTRIELETDIAIGHAVRKLDAHYVDRMMIEMAISRNGEKPELAVVDAKGLKGEDRKRIEGTLDEIGLKRERVNRILR